MELQFLNLKIQNWSKSFQLLNWDQGCISPQGPQVCWANAQIHGRRRDCPNPWYVTVMGSNTPRSGKQPPAYQRYQGESSSRLPLPGPATALPYQSPPWFGLYPENWKWAHESGNVGENQQNCDKVSTVSSFNTVLARKWTPKRPFIFQVLLNKKPSTWPILSRMSQENVPSLSAS